MFTISSLLMALKKDATGGSLMTKAANSFHILSRFGQTQVYLAHVRRAADTHKEELGFLPGKVYDEFARKECLYVLVADTPHGSKYAGHFIFRLSFPPALLSHINSHLVFILSVAPTTLLNQFK